MPRALALSALAIACSAHPLPERACPLWIDAQFSPAERAQISAAIDDWARVTRGEARIVEAGPARDIHPIRCLTSVEADGTGNPAPLAGWIEATPSFDYSLPRAIYIVPERAGDLLRGVTLHEIGHHWGLGHSADPASTMHTPLTRDCISQDTVDAWCDLYSCTSPHRGTC